MATLPPDPYAPDPVRQPDGTPEPTPQPPTLPGPENPPAPSAGSPAHARAGG
ncbi:hypothetical protein [Qipengyuania thermophila]|uniref:hypothetical protein n=1 Tax=Qipengyuania thermophila TaxID=2509361 RepID=UPI0013EC6E54|nr:hypothetical protein [Qipengyuania thermophila]